MPEFLETTVDKFTFRVPTDRFYSSDGMWVLCLQPQGGNRVRVGVTDYLQQHSGDVAFVTVKPPGTKLQVGDDLADLETIKVNLILPAPVIGAIAAINDALRLNPELVNQSPHEKGWLAEIDATDWEAGRALLLDAKTYFAAMKSQAEEVAKTL
jgi:glycine cleavage system H protein